MLNPKRRPTFRRTPIVIRRNAMDMAYLGQDKFRMNFCGTKTPMARSSSGVQAKRAWYKPKFAQQNVFEHTGDLPIVCCIP